MKGGGIRQYMFLLLHCVINKQKQRRDNSPTPNIGYLEETGTNMVGSGGKGKGRGKQYEEKHSPTEVGWGRNQTNLSNWIIIYLKYIPKVKSKKNYIDTQQSVRRFCFPQGYEVALETICIVGLSKQANMLWKMRARFLTVGVRSYH